MTQLTSTAIRVSSGAASHSLTERPKQCVYSLSTMCRAKSKFTTSTRMLRTILSSKGRKGNFSDIKYQNLNSWARVSVYRAGVKLASMMLTQTQIMTRIIVTNKILKRSILWFSSLTRGRGTWKSRQTDSTLSSGKLSRESSVILSRRKFKT
jgi:hypothetical protein